MPKFVSLSASAFAHEQERYEAAGFDDFIAKPFRFERICECLARLLKVEFESSPPVAADVNRRTDGNQGIAEGHSPADLARLVQKVPPELLAKLREATRQFNLTALNAHLDELEKLGEPSRQFAEHLRGWIRRFEMDRVAEALRSAS